MAAFLILSGIAVVWVLSLLVHPFGRCIRCQGKGNIVRGNRRPLPAVPRHQEAAAVRV